MDTQVSVSRRNDQVTKTKGLRFDKNGREGEV